MIPQIMHIANSESSVIYPGPILNGPPPGIFMQKSILVLSGFSFLFSNSLNDPKESPIKAP
jgi:hypothetical protein